MFGLESQQDKAEESISQECAPEHSENQSATDKRRWPYAAEKRRHKLRFNSRHEDFPVRNHVTGSRSQARLRRFKSKYSWPRSEQSQLCALSGRPRHERRSGHPSSGPRRQPCSGQLYPTGGKEYLSARQRAFSPAGLVHSEVPRRQIRAVRR